MRVFCAGPVITDWVSTLIAKLQVAAHFPTTSTASVPFLYHVHPRVQLFSHSHGAKFKRKPKCDIAITIAQFPAPPGAAAANPRSPLRAGRGTRIASHAQPFSHPSSPPARHRPNPSLAKHNRKPS